MVNVNKASKGRTITYRRGWYPIERGGDGVEKTLYHKDRVVGRHIHGAILKMVESVVGAKHGWW